MVKTWWVKQEVRPGVWYWWGPCADKETAEEIAIRIPGSTEVCSFDEYAREFINNSRNIIYQNQEGRTERERKRRLQRTWFLSVRLRWM